MYWKCTGSCRGQAESGARVLLARCTFYRFLSLFCSSLANIILPQGRTRSFVFETDDQMPTGGWKAISAALDRNQRTTTLLCGNLTRGVSPLTDRSFGIERVLHLLRERVLHLLRERVLHSTDRVGPTSTEREGPTSTDRESPTSTERERESYIY